MNNKSGLNIKKIFFLCLYYGVCRYLPESSFPLLYLGKISKHCRGFCCKQIFKKCGKGINIERMAYFSYGTEIIIGNYSGIGVNCTVSPNIKIGDYVMMGPNVYILSTNHEFSDKSIPMMKQGFKESKPVIIENDVWIGRDVLIMPGRIIKQGTVVAGGTVLTKNFEEYTIVGGNPSKLLKHRI